MPSHAGISARGLVKRFRSATPLNGADIDVAPGAIVALTGANGTGKTTALRIFATLLRAEDGEATVGGFDVRTQDAHVRRAIGVALVNERAMYWRLNGVQNMRFFARTAGLGKVEAARRSGEVLERVGLTGIAARPVAGYSAGQKQRMNLARAILAEPRVLLIDEPMRGLDEEGIALVRGLLRSEADRGVALLVAAPAITEFEDVCDEVLQLRAGRVYARAGHSLAIAGDA